MRLSLLCLVLAVALLGCPPCETETAPACVCDCPAGPPEPPVIDAFCATAPEGAACCLGADIGTCSGKECHPPQVK